MKRIFFPVCFVTALTLSNDCYSQGFLKKMKDKVNKTVDKALGNEVEKKTGIPTDQGTNNSSSSSSSGKPSNKGGGGLSNTEPPDVKAQMAEAETAHGAKNYSDARYSLQQALMGVEIQLGRQILKSLPATIVALPADTLQDKVMSTQWGWSNLNIQRVYKNGADKQLTVSIGNAGIYSGLANMYFANATMMEANGEKQNFKQVRVKGNKAIIQYEDSKGYTLIVPIGQTSMIVWECINFANEQEVMTAANSFDIDGIKKMLGEQ
ncbi:hypothetical protein QWZ08_21750 [Ferruginibacter paludis]|uniref:hypothetical protein n=1 Tax=Ferruginibacter paludis TaxID=1310417 RepID=UPI0025B4499F|nr:hypothetical protein [Ferruginibacter paludis]MDN3658293.1 hypothetical protein [Ferruginibacter paludis]